MLSSLQGDIGLNVAQIIVDLYMYNVILVAERHRTECGSDDS